MTDTGNNKIYGIYPNLDFQEFVIASKAYMDGCLTAILEKKGSFVNGPYTNTIYEYAFLDVQDNLSILELNGWKIIDFEILWNSNNYNKTRPFCIIESPEGTIYREDEVSISKKEKIDGIVQSIEYLLELSKFKNDLDYRYSRNIKILTQRIEILEKEVKQLKKKNIS